MIYKRYSKLLQEEIFGNNSSVSISTLNCIYSDLKSYVAHLVLENNYNELLFELHEVFLIINILESSVNKEKHIPEISKIKGLYESFEYLCKLTLEDSKFINDIEHALVDERHVMDVLKYLYIHPDSKIEFIKEHVKSDVSVLLSKLIDINCVAAVMPNKKCCLYHLTLNGCRYVNHLIEKGNLNL